MKIQVIRHDREKTVEAIKQQGYFVTADSLGGAIVSILLDAGISDSTQAKFAAVGLNVAFAQGNQSERIKELEQQLARTNKRNTALEFDAAADTARIGALEKQIKEMNQQSNRKRIKELETQLAEWDEALTKAESRIRDRDTVLADKSQRIKELEHALAGARSNADALAAAVQARTNALTKAESRIKELETQLAELERHKRENPADFEPHARGDGRRFHVRTHNPGGGQCWEVYSLGLDHICDCQTAARANMVAHALETEAERDRKQDAINELDDALSNAETRIEELETQLKQIRHLAASSLEYNPVAVS